MRVIFANYGQADNNSAAHIVGFARGLAERGHEVLVGFAKVPPDAEFGEVDDYQIVSHRRLLERGPCYRDKAIADILHVWTTREIVRRFTTKFQEAWKCRAVVVHLEDHEAAVFECFTGVSAEAAELSGCDWPPGLIHPGRHRSFLASAQGVTLVHQCLEPLVPEGLPHLELPPIIDPHFFAPGPENTALRESLGLAPQTVVISYCGNDHAASLKDVRLLYEAVDLLISRGRDIALVRTGRVEPTNYLGLGFRPGPRCIEMGYINRSCIPDVMRLADIVVQPGEADAFNSYRLPAKIPEYLSMGKPLIMGACNISDELRQQNAALVLPSTSPQAIADAVEVLLNNTPLSSAIAANGRAFAAQRFADSRILPALESFYRQLLSEV